MSSSEQPSLERTVYTVLFLTALGPVCAHGLWRPLATAMAGPLDGLAPTITLAAFGVASISALVAVRRPEQRVAVFGLGVLGGLVGVVVGELAGGLTLAVVALAAAAAGRRARRVLPPELDGGARRHPFVALVCLLSLLAMVGAADRVSTFGGDPSLTEYSVPTDEPRFARHLCLSAYVHGAELARARVDNIYDLDRVPTMDSTELPPSAAHMAPFILDRYGYPPQFLLAPLTMLAITPDFASLRAAWFGLNALLWAGLLLAITRWIGGRAGLAGLLAAPAMWAGSALVYQIGNAHLMVLAVALVAMMAFAEKRDGLGGLLLASAILAKISPGILGVVLVMRGRWRAVGWTVAWSLALTLVTLLLLGPAPFEAFFSYHLPKVSSGQAYDFIADPQPVAENLAPFGVPFRLHAMGVDIDPWVWGPRVSSVFTLALFGVAALVGASAGERDRRGQAVMWLGLLTLAGLRSPMAPAYVLAPAFLAVVLLYPEARGPGPRLLWFLGLALPNLLAPYFPMGMGARTVLILISYVALVWLVLKRWPHRGAGTT